MEQAALLTCTVRHASFRSQNPVSRGRILTTRRLRQRLRSEMVPPIADRLGRTLQEAATTHPNLQNEKVRQSHAACISHGL